MSTKVSVEHKFNKSADQVFAMYATRAFFERKYKDLGYTNIEVLDYKTSASGFSITTRYDALSDAPVPDALKKFLPTTVSVTQTDRWETASKTGSLSIEIKNMPVKVAAVMRLVAEGKGSANKLDFTLSCGIPLLGGKLESVLADDIRRKAVKDEAASQAILKDQN